MKNQICRQRAIFLLVTKQMSSHPVPQVLKCKAISMFGSFSLVSCVLSDSAGTVIREHHPCPRTQCWDKNEGKMGLGKRDWQNESFGLGRDENMMCGAGGVWEWKLWERLLALWGTSPSLGIFAVGQEALLPHNYVTMQATSVLLIK